MKISVAFVGLLGLMAPLSAAWSKEDHEIFRVRDEIMAHEGADVTFYDVVGVAASASLEDINRAYRKKSKALHPDKVKQQLSAERAKAKGKKKNGVKVNKAPTQAETQSAVKLAGERQARLSIVTNILRGADRDRYDYFLANGFPMWKGTGYYYSRYRPGLSTVLVGVFLAFGGAFHYLALYTRWKREREFVGRYIKFARHAAWGDNFGIPGVDAAGAGGAPVATDDDEEQPNMMPINRKQRRMAEREARKDNAKEVKKTGRGRTGKSTSGSATPVPRTQTSSSSGPTGAKKRVVAENGKVLVVDSLGDVYLEQEGDDGHVEEFLLDPNELAKPTFRDTAVYRIPAWAVNTFFRGLKKKQAGEDDSSSDEEGNDIADTEDSDAPQRTPSDSSAEDFEMLETPKNTDDLAQKASGAQTGGNGGGKAKKRNKKR